MKYNKRYKKSSPLKFLAVTGLSAAAVVGAFFAITAFTKNPATESSSDNSLSDISDISSAEDNSLPQSDLVYSSAESVTENPEPEFSPEISGELINNSDVKLPDGVKQLITDYTYDRYYALGALKFSTLEKYFKLSDTYGKLYASFCDTSLEYLIYVRQNRSSDLHYETASFTVTVTDVSYQDGIYTVDFEINDAIDFNCTGKTSYSCGMQSQAKIVSDGDDGFLFTQLAEDTDVNLLIEEWAMKLLGFDYENEYLKDMTIPDDTPVYTMFEKILEIVQDEADKNITAQQKALDEYNSNPEKYKYTDKADNAYNRTAAVEYSYKWVGESEIVRNPEFSDYSDYGGNCQNYVSQALYAAGIPMDWSGNADRQWKWFDDYSDFSRSPTGRSTSWSGTESFYTYCNENVGSGLAAVTDGNIFSAQKGDVMQYVVDGWAHHSVIVSDIIKDADGNVQEILINSNTTDRIDFPLSAYGYTEIRLIHISGWNN